MIHKKAIKLLLVILFTSSLMTGQDNLKIKKEMIFSAIKGTVSKPDTIWIPSNKPGKITINDNHSSFFKVLDPLSNQGTLENSKAVVVVFEPTESFVGIARATLNIENLGHVINLAGLSTKGLEGENEAPMAQIVEALGYKIDLGWTTLPNHLRPDPQGEELRPTLFTKAGKGNVEMIPVARYSPDFALNFGYYIPSKNGPMQHQVGILSTAKEYPEHQTLFPGLSSGQSSFDPGNDTFGLYAISPTHTVYSEDIWNILYHPTHASHGMRIYPVQNKNGVNVKNTYLVCMEEAANGDYNDYVFLIKNVMPVFTENEFTQLLNGKDFSGWYTWLESKGRNNDPENIFTIEEGGILHDMGKELGYIMTEKSFGNFHFKLQFKWGEKKWPPRDTLKRDSGICYNIPENEPDHIWPQSVECQIQEGDVGDFWLLGYSTIQVDGEQNPPLQHSRMIKKKDAEKPNGQWNTVEVLSFNGKCVHIVNGVVVNYGENSSLIGGKILLQSEYAEVYYRNVFIREF
ncbi:MAG TPA: DUF1080 domain-containing protein [Flavobacteriaceae bacterium]|nr:DUF1080 domain-containing protein [Flavobacteriaceae bacterium]